MTELWQTIAVVVGAFAALLAGIYAVITRPIQRQLAAILRRLARIETKPEDHSRRVAEITAGRRGEEMGVGCYASKGGRRIQYRKLIPS